MKDHRIANNYHRLLDSIEHEATVSGRSPKEISLVAVVKNRSVEEVMDLYHAGCRLFGENRLQEALPKVEKMPTDCSWHMIGSLQKNKVRKAVEAFAMIESVDTPELAEKISSIAQESSLVVPVLLQVNTSGESSKHGMSPLSWAEAYGKVATLPGICIEGLMTVAPFVEEKSVIRRCFSRLRLFRDQLPGIGPHLSMGMSHDYKEAIAEGATLLRVGSLLYRT